MLQKMDPLKLQENAFDMIGRKWLLIGAEKDGKMNAMTASWGGIGVLWNKQTATVYIRPQRYTKEFVDAADTFSLMVFDEEQRKALQYMGSTSGRDEDKTEHCGFHVNHMLETPYYEEANLLLICRKLYAQPLQAQYFIDHDIDAKNYPEKDYHTMYVGEIIGIYEKQR